MSLKKNRYMRKIGNMHKNFAKFSRVVFELCQRTDRQTDILITIFRTQEEYSTERCEVSIERVSLCDVAKMTGESKYIRT